jgi:hypothetical protein
MAVTGKKRLLLCFGWLRHRRVVVVVMFKFLGVTVAG